MTVRRRCQVLEWSEVSGSLFCSKWKDRIWMERKMLVWRLERMRWSWSKSKSQTWICEKSKIDFNIKVISFQKSIWREWCYIVMLMTWHGARYNCFYLFYFQLYFQVNYVWFISKTGLSGSFANLPFILLSVLPVLIFCCLNLYENYSILMKNMRKNQPLSVILKLIIISLRSSHSSFCQTATENYQNKYIQTTHFIVINKQNKTKKHAISIQ